MSARRSIRLVWLIPLIALLACRLTVGLPTSDDVNRLTDFNRLAYSDDSSSRAADSSELNTVFEEERGGEETAAQRKCPYGSSSE
uniref:Secreted protein n=1 Tax=Macrostomum lignano TaxID=282301 RepID=A0A1I8FRH6_9PLAT